MTDTEILNWIDENKIVVNNLCYYDKFAVIGKKISADNIRDLIRKAKEPQDGS